MQLVQYPPTAGVVLVLHLGLSCLMSECWRVLVYLVLQPSHHPCCSPSRCQSISIPHKRLHVFISHHLHDSRIDLVQFPWINSQDLILDRPDVRIAILDCRTLSWFIRSVCTAAVPQCTNKVHHPTLWAQCWYCLLWGASPVAIPIV